MTSVTQFDCPPTVSPGRGQQQLRVLLGGAARFARSEAQAELPAVCVKLDGPPRRPAAHRRLRHRRRDMQDHPGIQRLGKDVFRAELQRVFNDPGVGLDREPFVAGADTVIDVAVAQKGIRQPEKSFLALFSDDPFPGADMELKWVRDEPGGSIYSWRGVEGWLCPALLRYFPAAPKVIYVQIKEADQQ